MKNLARALGILGTAVFTLATVSARADVPPPPGQNRVNYGFQVSGVTSGFAAVAYPTYAPKGGNVVVMTPESTERLVQGYMPGLYVLPEADVASIVGKTGDEVQKVLDTKGHRCLEKVPRVWAVQSETKIRGILDVIKLDATANDCRATLVKTVYEGANGEKGEGGIDASGKRTPPPPFSVGDLESVAGMTGTSAPTSPTNGNGTQASSPSTEPAATPPANNPPPEPPPHSGCAGCAAPIAPVSGGAALATLALGMLVWRRRSLRSRGSSNGGRQAR